MTLSPEEWEVVTEIRDLAKATDQRVREVIVPAIKGDKQSPGLESRMNNVEDQVERARGAYKALAVLGSILAFILMALQVYTTVA